MAKPEYITKKVIHQKNIEVINEQGEKVKQTQRIPVEVRYRVDAAFMPAASSEICLEFIENYCEANNEGEWLVDEVQKTIIDKNGKKRDYPFVNLRADFTEKFFPEIVIGKKTNKDTMKARVLKRFGKK